MTTNQSRLTALRQSFDDALSERLAGATEVALLDMPYHDNVGDSLIWAGEVQALGRLGVKIRYASNLTFFEPAVIDRLGQNCVLLCHGGGNFGDTWPWSESFRLALAQRFPDRRIVVLPQSIEYADPENQSRAAGVLGEHRAFDVMVRDRASLQVAQNMGLQVHVSPDAAFGFDSQSWGISRFLRPSTDIVALWRTDKEAVSAGSPTPLTAEHLEADWLGSHDALRSRSWWGLAKASGLQRLVGPSLVPVSRFYDAMALREVRRGFSLLGNGRAVVTDRLHATVMAVMLGLPVVWVDNSYKKLSNVLGLWLSDADNLHAAPTRHEALRLAESLL